MFELKCLTEEMFELKLNISFLAHYIDGKRHPRMTKIQDFE